MPNSGFDRLAAVLDRAKRRAALHQQTKRRLLGRRSDKSVSEDYAGRLAEKARFRELLTDQRLDGLRFRWYFEHIETSMPLEDLRSWIDSKIAKEDARAQTHEAV
jgi:hypothetical protein